MIKSVLTLFLLVAFSVQAFAAPKIILKLDDLGVKSNHISCKAVMDLLLAKEIKASFGIIADRCDNTMRTNLTPYLNAKNANGEKLFEFWHHGLDHRNPEFGGQPYEYQKKHFEEADRIICHHLGIQIHTFGAPFNANDANTSKVVSENPNYKVTLFGRTPRDSSDILNLKNRVNVEISTAQPSFSTFVKNYDEKKDIYTDFMVLQAHPNNWSAEKLNEMEQAIDFLLEEGCEFVTPYEFYLSLKKNEPTSLLVSSAN